MSLFFETIRIEKGEIKNLFYHNKRLNKTIFDFYGLDKNYDLSVEIKKLKNYEDEFWTQEIRCKIIYNKNIESINLFPISERVFKKFKLIEANIDYNYKYCDRKKIDFLFNQKGDFDDIIMVKDGFLTDTSIANIAFKKNGIWFTPDSPIFYGSKREELLEKGFLQPKNIEVKDLKDIDSFAIMNAIVEFYEIKDFCFG